MAKSPAAITPREGGNIIDQFEEIVKQLISEAAAYAATGVEDPETSANIRRIKLLTASLMGALQTIR
jgi:hypothetical protein